MDGSYCRACKKFIVTSIEEHCQSREHYDKFVDIVNGKKVKAFEIQAQKEVQAEAAKQHHTEESGGGEKRKNEDEVEDEDDSGNWKRQKKNECPPCYEI